MEEKGGEGRRGEWNRQIGDAYLSEVIESREFILIHITDAGIDSLRVIDCPLHLTPDALHSLGTGTRRERDEQCVQVVHS